MNESLCNQPLAAEGLTSYRYNGTYGWIMIGAKSHEGAMREAARSTKAVLQLENLEVWNGSQYVNVSR